MRQAGVLAAAGLVALREGPKRLAADHDNARRLGDALAELPGVELDPTSVETNIGIFRVLRSDERERTPAARFARELDYAGVRMSAIDSERVRFVTHRDLAPGAVERAIAILRCLTIGEESAG
jgi:threonine aldolase